ncbi:hypothetical protein DGMP_21050 [Desulfomarina profundi]|uniref:Rhodanese domain-containing protein n=1 Tax=Desulfomarina profundi TaxID=2772557 RepID=A0A8D5FWU6_9BACT|nr:rhodanese-like domain-containing protein [Desulfomarina profundi]BCL61412.1 hypothetical protein DGMP_21050 [Desulfomarina profundi]
MARNLGNFLTLALMFLVVLPCQDSWSTSQVTANPTRSDISNLILKADQSFVSGKFEDSQQTLRDALKLSPYNKMIWSRYKQTVLARVGNDYLVTMPENRYRLSPADLVCALSGGAKNYYLLDVREKKEFATGHIQGSANIPFREVFNHLDQLPQPESKRTIVIICQTQHRANHVLVALRELGYSNTRTLRNGYSNYKSYMTSRKNDISVQSACASQNKEITKTNKTTQLTGLPAPGKISITAADLPSSQALLAGNFQLAVDLLQNILKENNIDTRLWQQYDRALLGQAGAQYLRSMPDSRLRLTVDDFISHYLTGDKRYCLLDVRSPAEFAQGHIADSINIPFRTLLQHLDKLPPKDSSKTVLLICRSQHRSIHNLVILRELGYTRVLNLKGGYNAYLKWLKKLPSIIEQSSPVYGIPEPTANPDSGEEEEEDFGC